MTPTLSRRWPRGRLRLILFGLCAVAAFAIAGCKPADEVEAYDAPKPPPPPERVFNRILGVLVAQPDATWSFKLVGPELVTKEHEAEFRQFMASLQFKDGVPTYKKPDAWLAIAPVEGRFAGFQVGPQGNGLELTVYKIEPGVLDSDQKLTDNINRWRQQLDLMKVGSEEALHEPKKAENKIEGLKLAHAFIDLKGYGSGKTSMAGAMAIRSPKSTTVQRGERIAYVKPEGWTEMARQDGPRGQVSVQREAAFQVSDGDRKLLVTIIPMGRIAGTTEANVQRWAGDIGAQMTPEQAAKVAIPWPNEKDAMGYYVDLSGQKDGEPKRTIALSLPRPDRTWFIKMSGSAPLVAREKNNFDAFLRTIRFEGGR
jgi:hypothetical protein